MLLPSALSSINFDVCTFVAVAVIVISLTSAWLRSFFGDRIPKGLKPLPGPWMPPFVGMIPFMGRFPYLKMHQLAQRYGELFVVKVGTRNVLVLNTYELAEKAYARKSFSGRPESPTINAILSPTVSRFVFRSGEGMNFLRKAAIRAIQFLATSKNNQIETMWKTGISSMMDEFSDAASKGKSINPSENIVNCISTVGGTMNFGGKIYEPHDPLLKTIKAASDAIGTVMYLGNSANYLPFGSILMKNRIEKVARLCETTKQQIDKELEKYTASGGGAEIQTTFDALIRTAETTEENELKEAGIEREAILQLSEDLYMVRFGTLNEVFRWGLNILAVKQDIQVKIHAEMDRVLGNRAPAIEDKDSLVFLEATINEVFRFASVTPLGAAHCVLKDTHLLGYFVPKGTVVHANVWAISRNPAKFPQPEEFQPERFLMDGGHGVCSINADLVEEIMPFSVGRRRCIAEVMGRQELFLLFASTLKRFRIEPGDGINIDLNTALPGINRRQAPYYKLKFTLR